MSAPRASAAVLLALLYGCGTGGARSGSSTGSPLTGSAPNDPGPRVEPVGPREGEAWALAIDGGDEGEEERLAASLGCVGLRDRAGVPALRAASIRAMRLCGDFSQLPWLAGIGAAPSDGDGVDALDAIVELAARPRRATDPEDADELHAGCAILLTLSRMTSLPGTRRVRAIRALRMLADRGCAKSGDIPADLDAPGQGASL